MFPRFQDGIAEPQLGEVDISSHLVFHRVESGNSIQVRELQIQKETQLERSVLHGLLIAYVGLFHRAMIILNEKKSKLNR
jgi:hypothetical protein